MWSPLPGLRYVNETIILADLVILIKVIVQVDYHHEPFVFSTVVSLFKNARVLLFLFGCITFGSCIGITWQFLFW